MTWQFTAIKMVASFRSVETSGLPRAKNSARNDGMKYDAHNNDIQQTAHAVIASHRQSNPEIL